MLPALSPMIQKSRGALRVFIVNVSLIAHNGTWGRYKALGQFMNYLQEHADLSIT